MYDESEEYARYCARAAKDCRCCRECQQQVCAGILAGGLCDLACWCGEEDWDCDEDDDQEPQP